MESHIVGVRGATKGANQSIPYGSVLSMVSVGIKFGDAAVATKEIFRTTGAKTTLVGPNIPSKKFPLFVRFFGHIPTAFDGTAPVFSLVETNIDDSGSVTIANIAAFAAGLFSSHKFITVDKKYKLLYTPATGAPTVGEGYYGIWVCGPGFNCLV
jgi:hypothetical protein